MGLNKFPGRQTREERKTEKSYLRVRRTEALRVQPAGVGKSGREKKTRVKCEKSRKSQKDRPNTCQLHKELEILI